MTIRVTAWAWEQELPPIPKLVLMGMSNCCDNDGNFTFTERTSSYLAEHCGITESDLHKCLDYLIQTKHLNNSYKINVPPIHIDVVTPKPIERPKMDRTLRSYIFERDGHICAYCGSDASQIDHIMPITKGGTDEESNLVACCAFCNSSKSNKLPSDFNPPLFSPVVSIWPG